MRILIDTHILLWSISEPEKLKKEHKKYILDTDNEIFLSVASIWECQIKQQIGKLDLPDKVYSYLTKKCKELKISLFPINVGSIKYLETLPLIHNDPFDRIIICSSFELNSKLITEDSKIKQYNINNLI